LAGLAGGRVGLMVWEICFSRDKDWRPITDWADLERELEKLNNKKHAYFNLSEDGMRYMKVYGGNQNRVIVEFSNVALSYQYQVLCDPTQTTWITIRDWHWKRVPPEICIDKVLAKRALKHFYETQEQLADMRWESWSLFNVLQVSIGRKSKPTRRGAYRSRLRNLGPGSSKPS
jgi:hypothetical protein